MYRKSRIVIHINERQQVMMSTSEQVVNNHFSHDG